MVPPLLPCLLLAGLVLAAPAVSAETWLRGRHGEVWIEEDGKYQPPKENHRGFSRVAATQRPVVYVDAPVERYDGGPTVIVRQPVYIDVAPWYGLRYYRRGYYSGYRVDRYRPYRRHRYARGYRGHHRGGYYARGRSNLGAVDGPRGVYPDVRGVGGSRGVTRAGGRGYGGRHRGSYSGGGRSNLGAVRGARGVYPDVRGVGGSRGGLYRAGSRGSGARYGGGGGGRRGRHR